MASIRKLEEEIARTNDPELRKRLQVLLEERKEKRDKIISRAKKEVDEISSGLEGVGIMFIIMIIIFGIIVLVLSLMGHINW